MKGDEFSGIVFYDKNGGIFSKSEVQLIGENIKRILTTRPGERVAEPEFGSHVMDFIFMPQLNVGDMIAEIIYSINKQEPRVTVNSCTLSAAGQDDIIHISLDLTLNTKEAEELTLGVTI
jgi:phage baseplate assembly protein W